MYLKERVAAKNSTDLTYTYETGMKDSLRIIPGKYSYF